MGLTSKQTQAIRKRLDGMNSKAVGSLTDDQIICEKCPIPDLQDCIDPVFGRAGVDMLTAFLHEVSPVKKAQSLLRFILMGGPNWASVKYVIAQIGGYLRA